MALISADFAKFSWILISFAVAYVFHRVKVLQGGLPLPPGPKGRVPFLGMTFDMPKEKPWVKLAEWSKVYGPIMYLQLGPQHLIYISDAQVSRDLLDKQSTIYSDRPPSIVGGIVSGNMRPILMPYGDTWRRVRKCLAALLTVKKCDSYTPIQENESINALQKIIDDPAGFAQHIATYSLSVARSVAYGKRVTGNNDQFARDVCQVGDNFTKVMTPGKYLVEYFPFLQYLPRLLQIWMPELEAFRDFERKVYLENYNQAIIDAKQHPDRPCIAADIKKEFIDKGDLSDVQAAATCGDILGAGSDTTSGQTLVFIQACIAFPEILKKAHEELDRVVGWDRFPTWADEPSLPYIRAIIKESHRWRPVAPLSFPRYIAAEQEYNGYRFPRNSIIYTSTWAIQMDPARYPDPQTFSPDRFINHKLSAGEYANMSDVGQRDHFNYGGGRRICVGLQLAERSLFMIISRLLHTFEILPALGPDGKAVPVDVNAYRSEVSTEPLPFRARFVIRNNQIAATLHKHYTDLFGNGQPESWQL